MIESTIPSQSPSQGPSQILSQGPSQCPSQGPSHIPRQGPESPTAICVWRASRQGRRSYVGAFEQDQFTDRQLP